MGESILKRRMILLNKGFESQQYVFDNYDVLKAVLRLSNGTFLVSGSQQKLYLFGPDMLLLHCIQLNKFTIKKDSYITSMIETKKGMLICGTEDKQVLIFDTHRLQEIG